MRKIRAWLARRILRLRQTSSTSPDPRWDEIEQGDRPSAILRLLPYALDRRADVASRATESLVRLLNRMTSLELARLDEQLRQRSEWRGGSSDGWWGMSPADLGRLSAASEEQVALLCLASFHPSGFVREAAVEKLTALGDGCEIPFLVIRLNDWVAPIRTAANKAIAKRLTPKFAARLVEALPLVFRLETCGRADHQPFIKNCIQLLRHTDFRQALIGGFRSSDRFVQRSCLEVALGAQDLDRRDLFRLAMAASDPIVRLKAARVILDALALSELRGALEAAYLDLYMPVRRTALRCHVKHFPNDRETTFRRFLFDRSVAIRSTCQRRLAQDFKVDVAALYRKALQAGRLENPAIPLAGLSEVGGPDDTGLAAGFLNSDRVAVRAAAIGALGKLDGDGQLERLLEALSDPSPRVSRAAKSALVERAYRIGGERIWQFFEVATAPHVRKHALLLLDALPRWQSLGFLLRAASEQGTAIGRLAEVRLGKWLHWSKHAMLNPSPAQVAELKGLFEGVKPRLEASLASEIAFLIRILDR